MELTLQTDPDFRLLFEACPHPYLVVLADREFTIVAVDDRYLAATNTTRSEIMGRGLFDVFPDNPYDGTATGATDLRVSLERVLRDGVQDVMGVQKYDIPRQQGSFGFEVKYWSPVNTPVFGDDGSVAMIIHHVEDITEFVLATESGPSTVSSRLDQAEAKVLRMEAEVLRRAAEVKAANRQIKAMLADQERRAAAQREAELARMNARLKSLDQAKVELLANVFHKVAVPQAGWARYLLSLGITAGALLLRLAALPGDAGLPFVTFWPATVVTVFLCGLGPGLLSVALGLVSGYFLFMPPYWSVKFAVEDVPVLAIYSLFGLVMCESVDRILRAAGRMSAVNAQLAVIADALHKDIAERKRTERALRDSEENFRSSFENAAIGMALVAMDGRWLQVNGALGDFLGYTTAELLDMTFGDVTYSADLDVDRAHLERLVAGRCQSYRVEKRYRRKNGEVVWALLSVSLVRDEHAAPVHFIAQFQDVSEQKWAEQKAQRLVRIVTMMSEGNQAVVHATDEISLCQAVCDLVVDRGGYRMAWIGLVEQDQGKTIRPVAHAGHEEGYLGTTTLSWTDNVFSEGPSGLSVRTGVPQVNRDFATSPVVGPWRRAALNRGYRSSISLPLKGRLGVFGVLALYAQEPDVFGDDELKPLVELAEDVAYGITALRMRRAHEELERTLFQAQKMESLGQLTGGVAHDFNNLLQVILSNLDLSLHGQAGSAAVAGYLQNAIAAAEQGAKLTGHLLAFARRQALRPEALRIDRLVGDMTNLLRRSIGETVDIELVTSGGLWTALVDSNQLQNAILNLAINARDAMPQGGKLTIELANASLDQAYADAHRDVKAGQYVMAAITDTGTGIPPEMLERVFEPFFTTKPEGTGTGLGLSMVYGFVKQSGGHIKIYSEVGHGTSVKLYLPRSQQAEARRPEEVSYAARGNGETILVAEDDDGVRASVVSQLSELGYRVLAVANGEAALDVVKRGEKADLLFTDVVMPGGLNGRALAARVRELEPRLPVVFTSGYTENAVLHNGSLEDGMTLLSKPYRLAQLAETIRKALSADGEPRFLAEPAVRPERPPISVALGERSSDGQDSILLVEDEDLVRNALADCLTQLGYDVQVAATPSEALAQLTADPTIRVMISDFSLPEMNGASLARRALSLCPRLCIILATGHHLDSRDLPDPTIRVMMKPFRPQALHTAIEAALRQCRAEAV